MKNKIFLSIAIFAISLLIIPQMTFASWWKPNTWKIFNRKSEVKTEQKIIATSTPNNVISQTEKATTTPTVSRSSGQSVGAEKIEQKNEEVRKPKGEVQEKVIKEWSNQRQKIISTPTPTRSSTSKTSAIPITPITKPPTQSPIKSKSSSVSPLSIRNSSVISTTVNLEVEQICQKVNKLNPKLLGNLVSNDLVLLADQLQTDCANFYLREQGLGLNLIKTKWDSYQKLENWDQSLLVALISNPTPDSFRNLCNNADKVKTPFASKKVGLSSDRTSIVSTSVPYTLYDIMMCKDFSDASSTVVTVTSGLLQWDFDNNDSDALRTKIINYNDTLKRLGLLENDSIVVIENVIVPFMDKLTKHLVTAKQEENSRYVSFAVYNPVKWAKKLMDKPAEAMIGTGPINKDLVMHTPPDFIINIFQVLVISASETQRTTNNKIIIYPNTIF